MHSGGLRRWCTCASWLQRVADLEELGDVRATHDRCDHCCATVVGVDLDTEGAGGVGAHRHTERGSLVHEEQSVPLRRGVAAHCRRRRPACGVHSRREHESGRHRDGTVSRFRTFVATWRDAPRGRTSMRGARVHSFFCCGRNLLKLLRWRGKWRPFVLQAAAPTVVRREARNRRGAPPSLAASRLAVDR